MSWPAADPGTPVTWRQEAAVLHRHMPARPARTVALVTDLLRTYWDLALKPHWRRLHGGLRSDIRSRMQVMEGSGAAPVFSSLNPRIAWRDGELTVRSAYDYQEDLGGRGIVLVPSVFRGPEVLTMTPPRQPMIVYPRTGVEEMWQRHTSDRPSRLAALLGGVRSAVLEALLVPASTGDLAEIVGPLALTGLLVYWGAPGRILLGALFVAAGLATVSAVRWGERTLAAHGDAVPETVDAAAAHPS
ncbi:hypothetical protein QZN11_02190 [Streptomyces gramineus]|uniref:hypothetical protein n=1 Tax=Streptomyces gramineus TaxID=910542 RepID=UPI00398AFEEA